MAILDFFSHAPPDLLVFMTRRCYAYIDWATGQWDALTDVDELELSLPHVFGIESRSDDTEENRKQQRYRRYCNQNISYENQGWFIEQRIIPYYRVLAVDEIGDRYNEGIHLLVEYLENGAPFDPDSVYHVIESTQQDGRWILPEEKSRVKFFPKEIPEVENLNPYKRV